MAGGLASVEPSSSAQTQTPQPAARRRAASTWSCERMVLPSGKGSRRQWSRKGALRKSALWPQYGPSSPCQKAWPVAQMRMPARMPNWNRRGKAWAAGRPQMRFCTRPMRGSAWRMRTRRRTVVAEISLSASSMRVKSWSSAWWSRNSITLPAL